MKIAVAVIALLLTQSAQSAASNCTTPKYENHNQIDYGPLRLSKIAGLAIDSFGAAVPQTCLYLFTEKTHRLVAGAPVDSNGKFALQRVKAGSYRLVAIAYGFCTANVPLIVTDITPHKRLVLHMKMAEIDVCSFGGYQ